MPESRYILTVTDENNFPVVVGVYRRRRDAMRALRNKTTPQNRPFSITEFIETSTFTVII